MKSDKYTYNEALDKFNHVERDNSEAETPELL